MTAGFRGRRVSYIAQSAAASFNPSHRLIDQVVEGCVVRRQLSRQAAETKARSAANEAQDWQIRHREAEATIAELAASVAGAEKRMGELATQRDELLASLDAATAPDHATDHAPAG